MKSKFLFWVLIFIVFGSLLSIGFLFVKTNVIAFFVIEGISILAIILFVLLYRNLIKPYQILSEGMDLLKELDFSSRLRAVTNKDANKLIDVFNKMMEQLKNERLHVREQNHFLDLLINASPQGLIILDFDEKISAINPSGLRLLNILDEKSVIGKKISDSDISIKEHLANLQPNQDAVVRTSGITIYRCIRSSFIDRGFAHPFILIEELTHELLKTEKKSYENIIRMMAHEVNNSVGAVSSTLNVISDILKQNDKNELSDVLPAVDASFDRCKHLSHFISNFAEVVKIPEPILSTIDLNELAKSVDALSNIECQNRNIKLTLNLTNKSCNAKIDGIQFEQVLMNIVKNACEAIGKNGEIRIITQAFPLSIIVEDNGKGISDEVKEKLFTPFFTTKKNGQGIGLMFIREILTDHNCKFDIKNHNGWTRFEILFQPN